MTATDRFRPSVTVAAVIANAGRYLLVEEETPEGLMLNNPAGHLEQGESPIEAVVREALEETARHFVPDAFLGVYLARFVRPARSGSVQAAAGAALCPKSPRARREMKLGSTQARLRNAARGLFGHNPEGRPSARGHSALHRLPAYECGQRDAPGLAPGRWPSRPLPQPEQTLEDVTYVRLAFSGEVGEAIVGRALDDGIVRTLWMTPEELAACAERHRSPLVLQCVQDHAAGRRLPLDAVHSHASLTRPQRKG